MPGSMWRGAGIRLAPAAVGVRRPSSEMDRAERPLLGSEHCASPRAYLSPRPEASALRDFLGRMLALRGLGSAGAIPTDPHSAGASPFHQTNDLVCRPGGFSVHASRQPRRNGAERLGRAGCEQQEERRRAGRRNRASNALNRNPPAPWSPHASACPSADIWPEPHFKCDQHQRRLTESSV